MFVIDHIIKIRQIDTFYLIINLIFTHAISSFNYEIKIYINDVIYIATRKMLDLNNCLCNPNVKLLNLTYFNITVKNYVQSTFGIEVHH